ATAADGQPSEVIPQWTTAPVFTEPFVKLVKALQTDIDWVRMHTELGELAAKLLANPKRDELLIRGQHLSEAINWISRQLPSAPSPTELIRSFINSSREGEAERLARQRRIQRRVSLLLAAVGVLVAFMLTAVIIGQRATELREAKIFTSLSGTAL